MLFSDYLSFLKSEFDDENINEDSDILCWIEKINSKVNVNIELTKLSKMNNWLLNPNTGNIEHKTGRFFSIEGLEIPEEGKIIEQPIINQTEVGFLGIIVKKFKNKYCFLMQAKIEPGNVNKVQISPTLQATKSNFLRVHRGEKPKYLEYFMNTRPENIIVDKLQSEQGQKFFRKRNRNIIIKVNEEIPVYENYLWMTLKQIRNLMKYDNYVNMDTRTVLSCIPYNFFNNRYKEKEMEEIMAYSHKSPLFKSFIEINTTNNFINNLIVNKINDIKMFNDMYVKKKSLTDLSSWNISDDGVFNKSEKNFEVLFCDIEIEGREVTRWDQPLLKPKEMELIIFLMKKINAVLHFLIRLTKEYGIYDGVEIGASMHIAKSELDVIHNDEIKNYLIRKYKERTNIVNTSLLSEEGGRFYHEQNLYLIIQADEDFNNINVNNEYFWVTLGQLNYFIQSDNFVNIQARNLFTLIKLGD